MRFTLSFLALSAVTMMADPTFLVVASDATPDLVAAVAPAEQDQVLGGGDDKSPAAPIGTLVDANQGDTIILHESDETPLHTFPLVFNFEIEGKWKPDPETIRKVEEAVILAANEAQASQGQKSQALKFYGIATSKIYVEDISKEDDFSVMPQDDVDGNRGLRFKPRPIRLRGTWRSQTVIACKLCREDDDYGPLMLDSLMMRATLASLWQHMACSRIRTATGLMIIKKCFIYLDTVHDDSLKPLDTYESVTFIEDFYNDGFSLGTANE